MGRFRIGSKEVTLIVDKTIPAGELVFDGDQNNSPAKLFVDSDGKLKFKNRGQEPKFIGDGAGSGLGSDGRSVIQGDRNPNEYHDMLSIVGLTSDQIDYYNDVKAAKIGDSYIDNENFILYLKKRETQSGSLHVWVQKGAAFKGSDGSPTVNGVLSNETHTVLSTADGVLTEDLSNAGGHFSIFNGTVSASNVIFKISKDGTDFKEAGEFVTTNGVSITINSSGIYSLQQTQSGWDKSVDTINFFLKAIVGTLEIDKTYTIMKSKGAGVVRLVSDKQAFTKDGSGDFSPSNQTIKFSVQTNNIASNAIVVWKIYKSVSETEWYEFANVEDYLVVNGKYATLSEQSFENAAIFGNITSSNVRIRALVGDVYDDITILTISDGAEGARGPQGIQGENAYNGLLTNESHTVVSDSDGTNVIGLGTDPVNKAGGFYRIYKGTSLLSSGVTFSTVGTNSTISDGVSSIVQNGLKIQIIQSTGEYRVDEISQNSWTSDSETFTLRAVVDGIDIDKKYSISKSKGGINAKILYLTSDKQTFTADSNGNLSPQTQTIRFTAKLQNISIPNVTWTLWKPKLTNQQNSNDNWEEITSPITYLSSIETSGDSCVDLQLDQEKFEALFSNINTIRILAEADGFSDEVSTIVVKDGAKGTSYSALLTNESHLVPADVDGIVSVNLTSAGGYFLVYKNSDLASNVSFSVHEAPTGTGISAIIDQTTGEYQISQNNWSTDSATFTFRATISENSATSQIDKIYTIAKSKAGVNGQPAKLIYLTSTNQAFKKNGSGAYDPSQQTIQFNADLQNMSVSSVTWELYRLVSSEWIKQTDLSDKLSVTGNTSAEITQNQFNAAIGNDGSSIKVVAKADGLSDKTTINVVKDGTDGQGSYNAFLTNESHLVAASNQGFVSNQELTSSGASGQFLIYKGTEEISGTYSIKDGIESGSYYKKTIDGLTLQIEKSTGNYSAIIENNNSWDSNSKSVAFTLRATAGNTTIEKVFSISKSLAGVNGDPAKLIYLTSDAQAFTLDGEGSQSPPSQIITFNALLQNANNQSVNWAVSRHLGENNWSNLALPDTTIITTSSLSASMNYSQFLNAVGFSKRIKVKASIDGSLYDEITISTLKDGAKGSTGASGSSAKVVKLESNAYQIAYNAIGSGQSTGSITLSGSQQNHSGTVYYEFLTGSVSMKNSTVATHDYAIFDFNSTFGSSGAPIVFTLKTREGSSSGTIIAQDSVSLIGTKEGATTLSPMLTNATHAFLAESNGFISASNYVLGATDLIVYQGNTKLTPVTYASQLTAGQFKANIIASSISISSSIDPILKKIIYTPDNMTSDSANVIYAITGSDSKGIEYAAEQIQTFSKSKQGLQGITGPQGSTGASGSSSKVVKLESNAYQIAYNSIGTGPSTDSITLSGSQQNHSGTVYYEFLTGSVSMKNSTVATHDYTISDFNSTFGLNGTPIVFTLKTREGSSSGTIIAQDSISLIGTKEGATTLSPMLTNATHAFPAESNGFISASNYVLGSTDLIVYQGNTKLIPVSYASQLSTGQFKTNIIASSISVSSSIDTSSKKITYTPDNMTSDSANVIYAITGSDSKGILYTIEQTQTFSKSKQGIQVATGATGTSSKIVKLESTAYQIAYNSAGSGSNPQNIILSGSSQNHSGTVYYELISGSTTLQNATSSAKSITFGDFDSMFGTGGSPITYIIKTREGSDTGSVVAQDSITIVGTKAGSSAINVVLSNETHAYVATAAGVVSSTIGGSTDITAYEGNVQLTPVTMLTGAQQYTITKVESTGYVGTLSISGNKFVYEPVSFDSANDAATVTFTVTIRNKENKDVVYTKVQSLSKSKQGAQGSKGDSGLSSKVVKLESNAYQIAYNSIGTEPSTGSITLSGSQQNHSGTVYYEFLTGSVSMKNSTIATHDYAISDFNSTFGSNGTPIVFTLKTREENSSGTVIAQDSISLIGTKEGSSTLNVVLTNETHAYAANPDGSVISIGDGATDIYVYEGSNKLTPVATLTAASQFTVSEVESSGYAGAIGSADTTNKKFTYTPSSFSSSNDTATVTFTITARDKNGKDAAFTRVQTLSKSKQGKSQLLGKGVPGPSSGSPLVSQIEYYSTAATWVTYASQNSINTNSTEAQEDWNEVKNAKIGDRYINTIDGVTYVKTGTNTWAAKTNSIVNAVTPGRIGLGNVANLDLTTVHTNFGSQTPSTIRGGITIDSATGKLIGIGTPDVIVSNSKISAANIAAGVGVNSVDELKNVNVTKSSVGLGNVANLDLTTVHTNFNGKTSTSILGETGITNWSLVKQKGDFPTPVASLGTFNLCDGEQGILFDNMLNSPTTTTATGYKNYKFVLSTHYVDAATQKFYFHVRKISTTLVSSDTLVGYVDSNVANNQLNFTGQHKTKPTNDSLLNKDNVGLIVVSTGVYNNATANQTISINESLPVVELSTKRNQKSVFGIVSDSEDIETINREYRVGNFVSVQEKKSEDDHRLIINSLGEGAIWVTNINGDLENGDYITSCEIPGYGMKQDDDILHSYTVAKITCDCDFDLNSQIYKCEEFEWEGKTYRKAFVGCTYHCG